MTSHWKECHRFTRQLETGNFEIMQILLAYGAKPNLRDYKKRTPLMMLDEDADTEMARVLLSYGAKIKLIDSEKNTVLHHYAEFDDAAMVRLLVSHGADPNAKNRSGRTAADDRGRERQRRYTEIPD